MGPVERAPLRSGGEARGGDDRSDLLREMEIEFRAIAGRRERLPCMPLGPFEEWSAGALKETLSVETRGNPEEEPTLNAVRYRGSLLGDVHS
jgi:hypothetical protein